MTFYGANLPEGKQIPANSPTPQHVYTSDLHPPKQYRNCSSIIIPNLKKNNNKINNVLHPQYIFDITKVSECPINTVCIFLKH